MKEKFNNLVKITKRLRSKDGCPWDKEQTFESLRSHLIEESYEVISAINEKDYINLNEELGDILLQILLISNIAEEENIFTIEQVIEKLSEKLIRRHPHVFGDRTAKNSDDAKKIWEEQKNRESNQTKSPRSKSFPSLIRAVEISKYYSKVSNLDWESSSDLLQVLDDEKNELQAVLKKGNEKEIEEELGDVLFTIANLCRKENINPEIALNESSDKFVKRADVFLKLRSELPDLSEDELWDKAKSITKKSSK